MILAPNPSPLFFKNDDIYPNVRYKDCIIGECYKKKPLITYSKDINEGILLYSMIDVRIQHPIRRTLVFISNISWKSKGFLNRILLESDDSLQLAMICLSTEEDIYFYRGRMT